MRIACLQLAARGAEEPWDARVDAVLAQVATVDADLVVLPELWATGFFAFGRYAEDALRRDALLERCGALARERRITFHAGSHVERGDGGALHNTAAVFDASGALVATYRKVHLWGHGTGEATMLVAGDEVVVTPLAGLSAGLTTCYDLRFPEQYRALTDRGAEVVITVSAWPAARVADWELLNRARAVEGACLVVACNGCGEDSGTALGGRSVVVGPDGGVLAAAGDGPEVLVADVDPAAIARRRADFPVLDDRRFAVSPRPA